MQITHIILKNDTIFKVGRHRVPVLKVPVGARVWHEGRKKGSCTRTKGRISGGDKKSGLVWKRGVEGGRN